MCWIIGIFASIYKHIHSSICINLEQIDEYNSWIPDFVPKITSMPGGQCPFEHIINIVKFCVGKNENVPDCVWNWQKYECALLANHTSATSLACCVATKAAAATNRPYVCEKIEYYVRSLKPNYHNELSTKVHRHLKVTKKTTTHEKRKYICILVCVCFLKFTDAIASDINCWLVLQRVNVNPTHKHTITHTQLADTWQCKLSSLSILSRFTQNSKCKYNCHNTEPFMFYLVSWLCLISRLHVCTCIYVWLNNQCIFLQCAWIKHPLDGNSKQHSKSLTDFAYMHHGLARHSLNSESTPLIHAQTHT